MTFRYATTCLSQSPASPGTLSRTSTPPTVSVSEKMSSMSSAFTPISSMSGLASS